MMLMSASQEDIDFVYNSWDYTSNKCKKVVSSSIKENIIS